MEPRDGPLPEGHALLLAAPVLVVRYFNLIDRHDLDGALALYAEDARFLAARGRAEIRQVMERGLAPNAGHRSRHVVANVAAEAGRDGSVVVTYTALAYTLDTERPPLLRTLLDQEMLMIPGPSGALEIAAHDIFGYEPLS